MFQGCQKQLDALWRIRLAGLAAARAGEELSEAVAMPQGRPGGGGGADGGKPRAPSGGARESDGGEGSEVFGGGADGGAPSLGRGRLLIAQSERSCKLSTLVYSADFFIPFHFTITHYVCYMLQYHKYNKVPGL